MHDGRFKKLKEVVNHYSELSESGKEYSKELKKIKKPMSESQQKDLISFLKTLSDKDFLYNPVFMYPKNERIKQEK
jgi:cytochrome c peroxidase